MFAYKGSLQGRRIRLIQVLPDSDSSTLSVQLVERNLDESVFEALSYVWGDQTGKKRIKCNGKRAKIGANLHAALKEIRRRKSVRLLWADQICINQSDIREKNHQVRLMSDIYARADRVIIWLGEQQPRDIEGMSLASTLYLKENGNRYDLDIGIYDFHKFDCKSRGVPDPEFNPTWTALFGIIANSWFGRIWVVQELLMAQKSIMWKGSLDLDTDVMLWSAMLIQRHKNLSVCYDISMGSPEVSALRAANIAAGYYDFKNKGPLPIYDTLSRHLGMGATDPRDRFFALVGVSSGLAGAFINYNKAFRDIACLVGKMTLLGTPDYHVAEDGTEIVSMEHNPENYRFLIDWLAFHANPQNHSLGIPSWVPDLVSPHSTGLILTGFYKSLYLLERRDVPNPEIHMDTGFYRVSGSSGVIWQTSVPNEIQIKGANFDEVKTVARSRPKLPSADQSTKNSGKDFPNAIEAVSNYETEMVYWLSTIRMLADPSLDAQGSMMDGQSFDAFWRNLLYNRGPRFDYKSPNKKAGNYLGVRFGYWYLWKKYHMAKPWRSNVLAWAIGHKVLKKLAEPFEEAESRVQYARNFFVSHHGRIGWVPFRTRTGDRICVFRGVRMPFVLRPQQDRWEIIGACYVHGLMDGEVWDLTGLEWKFMRFV